LSEAITIRARCSGASLELEAYRFSLRSGKAVGQKREVFTLLAPSVLLQMQAELGGNEAMTCQELLALSGALSAALPTGQLALDSFLNSLTKGKYLTP